jgi:dihydroxy-acid dehydratase
LVWFKKEHNGIKYSKRVTQDDTQPAAQSMLYAIGLTEEDMKNPLVGVGSTG